MPPQSSCSSRAAFLILWILSSISCSKRLSISRSPILIPLVLRPQILESLGFEHVSGQRAIVVELEVVPQVGLQSELLHQPGFHRLALAFCFWAKLDLQGDSIDVTLLGHLHLELVPQLGETPNDLFDRRRRQEDTLNLGDVIGPSHDTALDHPESPSARARLS